MDSLDMSCFDVLGIVEVQTSGCYIHAVGTTSFNESFDLPGDAGSESVPSGGQIGAIERRHTALNIAWQTLL